MIDHFKKVIGIFLVFIFWNSVYAQTDSTDFLFTAVTPESNNGSLEFALEFTPESVSGFEHLTIELLVTNSETVEELVYTELFDIADLNESQYYSNGSILIHPGTGIAGYNYCVVIRLTDSNGHQLVINKNLVV